MRLFLALLGVLIMALPAMASTGKRIALVVGIGAYKEAPLKNPANDARDMAARLRELGFDVTVAMDADRAALDSAVQSFSGKLDENATGLFYYAGHGIQIDGNNYMVPVGADLDAASDIAAITVPVDKVLKGMAASKSSLNIVILDACRNNPFTDPSDFGRSASVKSVKDTRGLTRGLARINAPAGTLIAYATAPGAVALDGKGDNGIYTKHLLNALTREGVSIQEALMDVRRGVFKETGGKQIPWESSSLLVKYYFAGQPSESTVADMQKELRILRRERYLFAKGISVKDGKIMLNPAAASKADDKGVAGLETLLDGTAMDDAGMDGGALVAESGGTSGTKRTIAVFPWDLQTHNKGRFPQKYDIIMGINQGLEEIKGVITPFSYYRLDPKYNAAMFAHLISDKTFGKMWEENKYRKRVPNIDLMCAMAKSMGADTILTYQLKIRSKREMMGKQDECLKGRGIRTSRNKDTVKAMVIDTKTRKVFTYSKDTNIERGRSVKVVRKALIKAYGKMIGD